MSDVLKVEETPEVSKPFGTVYLNDGFQLTIDDSCDEVKAYLAEFPDASIEVAIEYVTEKLQNEENAKKEVVAEAPVEVAPTEEVAVEAPAEAPAEAPVEETQA